VAIESDLKENGVSLITTNKGDQVSYTIVNRSAARKLRREEDNSVSVRGQITKLADGSLGLVVKEWTVQEEDDTDEEESSDSADEDANRSE